MKCPFLQETEVRSCQTAGIRKLIRRNPATAGEKCSSGGWPDCALYREQENAPPPGHDGRCPFLSESVVNYCGAASFTKFVPYSESVNIRCGNGGFRYCSIYLNLAHAGPEPGDRTVDGLPMPGRLHYSRNHMWLDRSDDGSCHIGIDAFMAKALQRVDGISFVTMKGVHHPTAVLKVRDAELHLVFPNPLYISQPNLYLRANPAPMLDDPYCSGWLFEAREIQDRPAAAKLLSGASADKWMQADSDHLSVLAHRWTERMNPNVAGDGGTFGPDLLEHLTREEKLGLFHQFFSPYAGVERETK